MKKLLIFLFPLSLMAQSVYVPPADRTPNGVNGGWLAGFDLWNGGVKPNYPGVACAGVVPDGTTDNAATIQACINAASSNTAVALPAGSIYYNSPIVLKSGVVLRGAAPVNQGKSHNLPASQPSATRMIPGTSGTLTTQNFSFTSGSLVPAINFGLPPAFYCNYTNPSGGTSSKGDTQVKLSFSNSSCNLSVGSWIQLQSNDDPQLITTHGTAGSGPTFSICNYCGNNNGINTLAQIVQVLSFASGTGGSGSVANISRPMYFTPYAGSVTVACPNCSGGKYTEPAGTPYEIINFGTVRAGFEDFQVDGSVHDVGANRLILFQGCLECWANGVETAYSGSNNNASHFELDESYGVDISNDLAHDQRSGASGAGYGFYEQFVNSDNKFENDIGYHLRHAFIPQGGGTGSVHLYNFWDDGYTDDGSYLASARTNHGAQPQMELWEGNIGSNLVADDFIGSSAYIFLFRNWFWSGETDTAWPSGQLASFTYPTRPYPPTGGYAGVNVYSRNSDYSLVNNMLGRANPGTGGFWANWAGGTLTGFNPTAAQTAPIAYSIDTSTYCNVSAGTCPNSAITIPAPGTTMIRQGNWDLVSNSVAFNDGGTCGGTCTYVDSMYYTSAPSYFGSCTWPGISGSTNVANLSMPAYNRAMELTCSAINYTLTVSTSGTGTVSGSNCTTGSYASGTAIGPCSASPGTGYTFAGWSGTGACSGVSGTGTASCTLTGNSTLTAAFSPCTVGFSPPAGTYAGTQAVTISTSSCPAGTQVFYRTDGLPATNIDTLYSTPVSISSSQTLTTLAVLNPTIRDQPQTISANKKCNATGAPITFPSGLTCSSPGGVAGVADNANNTPGTSNQLFVTTSDSTAFDTSVLFIDTPTATDSSIVNMSHRIAYQDTSNCSQTSPNFFKCSEVAETDAESCCDATTHALWQMSVRCSTNAVGSSGNNGFLEGDASSGNEKWDIACVIGANTDLTVNSHWTLGDTGCGGSGCMVLDSIYLNGTKYTFPASCDSGDTNCPNYPMTPQPTFAHFIGGSQDQVYARNVTTAGTSPLTTTRNISFARVGVDEGTEATGSAAYVINGAVATPTFSPGAGSYSSAQSVTISSSTSGATIHYTTDGSTPTSSSTTYTAPVFVGVSLTLKALAIKSGFVDSSVGSAAYVITIPPPVITGVISGLVDKSGNIKTQ